MFKSIITFVLASTFFIACKSNKGTANGTETNSSAETKTTEAAAQPASTTTSDVSIETQTKAKVDSVKEDPYRLSVVFFSIGSGTENNYMRAFEDYIGEYAGKTNKNIDYEKTPWGREGETDYCLRLNELNAKEQVEFIAGVNDVLKGAKWVHIYENQPCMHKAKR